MILYVSTEYKHLFSMIGIAETYIEQCHKDLYRLNDYIAEYCDKIPNKHKGSGIVVYVHNDYIFNKNNELTQCTKNLETITNTATSITFGAVYRPPSGSIKYFLAEWEGILVSLPKTMILKITMILNSVNNAGQTFHDLGLSTII